VGGGRTLIPIAVWTSIAVSLAVGLLLYGQRTTLYDLAYRIGGRTPPRVRQNYSEAIDLLGLSETKPEINPEYLAGLKYGLTLLFGGAALIAFITKAAFVGVVFIALALAAWTYPDRWLENLEKKRREDISREFPIMVTLVKVYAHASDLHQALDIVRGNIDGELKRQLTILRSEMAVYPLKEVMERFAYRCKNPLISNFVSVVLFGMQTGSNVDDILDTFAKRSYEIRVNDIKRKIKAQPIIMSVLPAIMMFSLILLFVFPMYADILDKLSSF